MMPLTTLACTLLLAAPQGPSAQQAATPSMARVLRYVSIRDLIARPGQPQLPPLGSLLGLGAFSPDVPQFLLGEVENRGGVLQPVGVVDLLRAICPIDIDASDELRLQTTGATLVVAGPPDQVHMVETSVRELTRAMVHRIRLHAALYRLGKTQSIPAVATPEQLRSLVGGLEPLWEASTTATSGGLASLIKERTVAYLADVGVEVAQGAKIGDPVQCSLFEGVSLVVEPHALTETRDLALYCQLAFGEQPEPLGTRGTTDALPSIDVPHLAGTSGVISGRVPNGGALLLAVRGEAAPADDLLLAVRAEQDPAAPSEDAGIYPVSALLSGALRAPVSSVPPGGAATPWAPQLRRDADRDTPLGPRDPAELLELLEIALGDFGDAYVQIAGGHVVVKGSAEQQQAAARVVSALQDESLATVQVELSTVLAASSGREGVFGSAPADGAAALRRITFPALVGRPHVLVSGRETTVISDYEVEIAQKASVANPVVVPTFDGAVVALYAYPLPEGLGVEATLDVMHAAEPTRRAPDAKDGSELYLPRGDRARFTHTGPIATGQELVLGDGPSVELGSRTFRTRQILRISKP